MRDTVLLTPQEAADIIIAVIRARKGWPPGSRVCLNIQTEGGYLKGVSCWIEDAPDRPEEAGP